MANPAVIGVVGIVVGAVLGGTGKYFTQRRDAWVRARASGLALLAQVRWARVALAEGHLTTEISVADWKTHGPVLASFRPGNYPSGLNASQWLELARLVTVLARLDAMPYRGGTWMSSATYELRNAQKILDRFEHDPPVLASVIRTSASRHPKTLATVALGLVVGIAAIVHASS